MSSILELNPYEAIDSTLPASGDERLKALLAWALLSPSPHNTQPWLWSVDAGAIDLHADYSRQLTVSDPDGRELTIGCGSSLEHLLLRLGQEDTGVALQEFPDATQLHHLARVTTGAGDRYPRHDDLVRAMGVRRTNRTAYHGEPMDDALRKVLTGACREFGVTVTWVQDTTTRASLVDLIMASDREQMASKEFRHELSHWMRPEHSHREDGMEADLLGEKGIAAYVAPLIVRTFDVGKMQAATDEKLTEGSPDIAVLSTTSDDVAAWLSTGRALARMILTAMAGGRYSAYMNQPCEVPESRVKLASLLGVEHPQLVVRFGLADPVHAALRFPVAKVLQ
jgi:nitroreductase